MVDWLKQPSLPSTQVCTHSLAHSLAHAHTGLRDGVPKSYQEVMDSMGAAKDGVKLTLLEAKAFVRSAEARALRKLRKVRIYITCQKRVRARSLAHACASTPTPNMAIFASLAYARSLACLQLTFPLPPLSLCQPTTRMVLKKSFGAEQEEEPVDWWACIDATAVRGTGL